MSRWSPELEFIMRCARLAPAPADLAHAHTLAATPLDWERVRILARYHGLYALVSTTLDRPDAPPVPAPVRDALHRYHLEHTAADLRLHDRWLTLTQALSDAGIRVVTLKGFATVHTIYGRIGLRPAGDLDLLVATTDVARAIAVLTAHGSQLLPVYRRALEHVGLPYITSRLDEIPLVGPPQTIVDLHWRAGRPGRVPDAQAILEGAVPLTVGASERWIPHPAMRLALLIAHGHDSGWSRLRWLVDVVEGLNQADLTTIAAARTILQQHGDEVAFNSAAQLAHQVWEDRGGSALADAVPGPRPLVPHAAFERDWDPAHRFDGRRPLRMLRQRFERNPTIVSAIASAFKPNYFDWGTIRLPASLRAGYVLVRPLRILMQALRHSHPAASKHAQERLTETPVKVQIQHTQASVEDVAAQRTTEAPPPRNVPTPSVPVTFVTAVYDSGPDSILGGRGRGIEYFLPTLINVRNLGGSLVLFCDPGHVDHIRQALAPDHDAITIIPLSLTKFEYFDLLLASKATYRDQLLINDRNEVLCFMKSYFVQMAIEAAPYGHTNYFWIDAGLPHHGIFPLHKGGVEMWVKAPAEHYYPHNPRNIFTPQLGAAILAAPQPGTVLFCAHPGVEGTKGRSDDEGVAAAVLGGTPGETPVTSHLVGGLFGGRPADLQALHADFRAALLTCLQQKVWTLEEQIFSTLFLRDPERFTILPFGNWYFHAPGEPNSLIDHDTDSFFKIFTRLVHVDDAPPARSTG